MRYGIASSVRADNGDQNTLVLVVSGDTFDLYVNGEYVATARDSTHTKGVVSPMVLNDTGKTQCIFDKASVWVTD